MRADDEARFIDSRYAKNATYGTALTESAKRGVCPLCTLEWHTKPILKEERGWFITENSHPYPNTRHHLLLIPRLHIEKIQLINPDDWATVIGLITWAEQEFQIPGAGLVWRFGDTTYTGATVKHLHGHLIVPTVIDGTATPVYFPIG